MNRQEFLNTIRHIEYGNEGRIVSVMGIIPIMGIVHKDMPKPSSDAVFDWLGIEKVM